AYRPPPAQSPCGCSGRPGRPSRIGWWDVPGITASPSGRFSRRGRISVLVGAFRAGLSHEIEEHQSDERDQSQEYPPPALAGVVQAPYTHAQSREQQAQNGEHIDEFVDRPRHDVHDDLKQKEPPEFRPARTAVEVHVLLRQANLYRLGNIHGTIPPFSLSACAGPGRRRPHSCTQLSLFRHPTPLRGV